MLLLDQILFHVPCPIFWKDLNSAFLGCNKLFLEMSGLTEYSELLGKRDVDMCWKEFADLYTQDDQYVMRTGQTIKRVEKIPLRDRVIIAETTKSPLMEDDKIIGILAICLDITAEKEAEQLKIEKLAEQEKFTTLAKQVAHDIRSPLAALNTCLQYLPQIPENQRILLRNASNRINDIANNLLEQYKSKGVDAKGNADKLKVWLLAPIVDSIISEKRLQLEGRPIELEMETSTEGFSAFSKIDAPVMKRILSNLINNAAEAFTDRSGKIVISLDAKNKDIMLQVKDNGCGIPKDKLEEVLKPGVSLKESGSGLGLSHAKDSIETLGGHLSLESTEGEGTTVKITLPRATAPKWFVSKIIVSPSRSIAILDDDQSVHDAWDQRLLKVSGNLNIHHFKTPKDFKEWYRQVKLPVQVFSDYELLGEAESGLDVLEVCKIENAILVTSHYENPDIIKRCEALNAHLLPKNLLAHIVIEEAQDAKQKIDAIFIDDDPYNHEYWQFMADQKKKHLLCFTSLHDFEGAAAKVARDTPIYIDLNLKGMSGLDVAKTLHEKGFKTLYISTGYADFEQEDYPFLAGVLGKAPPF